MDPNSQKLNEYKESDFMMSTPSRQTCSSSTPNINLLKNFSINTPKGSKFHHPFLSNIIHNLDKPFTSPDMFNKAYKYPIRDSCLLSPDLIGNLFPNDINTNIEFQYQFEDKIFKNLQSYCDMKTAKFFTEHIKQSPESYDSGIGFSVQSTEPSSMDIDKSFVTPISLLANETPPSKFKWNREEYKNKKCQSSLLHNSGASFEDFENLESTHIDTTKFFLADNLSMRQQSIIESPMFYEEKFNMSSKEYLRSSPHNKCNPLAMNDINISPIKHNSDEEMETDDEFL